MSGILVRTGLDRSKKVAASCSAAVLHRQWEDRDWRRGWWWCWNRRVCDVDGEPSSRSGERTGYLVWLVPSTDCAAVPLSDGAAHQGSCPDASWSSAGAGWLSELARLGLLWVYVPPAQGIIPDRCGVVCGGEVRLGPLPHYLRKRPCAPWPRVRINTSQGARRRRTHT